VPGPGGRGVGGRGVVRNRGTARGWGAGRRRPRPGRRAGPAGPGSRPRLAAQVVASLLDGCEIVLVRPPAPATAPIRKRLEAALRRGRGVLLVAGDWSGAQVRLRVGTRRWTGLGDGHGRLRACCAEVTANGRGQAAATHTRWLWLPAEDGTVTVADPAGLPADFPLELPVADIPSAGISRLTQTASAG